MIRYAAGKLAGAIIALAVLSVVIFGMVRLLPGSIEGALLGPDASPEVVEAMRSEYGLDEPIPVQYWIWATNVASGDFGESLRTNRPIGQAIAQRIRPSLELALGALAVALAAGIGLGALAGLNEESILDRMATTTALVGLSVPDFVVGLGLVALISGWLGWLPGFGYEPLNAGLITWLSHMILPIIALSMMLVGSLARLTRRAIIEMKSHEHVRTAIGKGLAANAIARRHVIRPSLGPVVSTAGVQLVAVLGGVVVIEFAFSIPGIGSYIVEGLRTRDYPVIQAATLLAGVFAVVVNFAVDIINRMIDPRIQG